MMTDHIAADDPLLVLPRPKDVRAALSRRLREAEVLRRLLKVTELAAIELADAPQERCQAVAR